MAAGKEKAPIVIKKINVVAGGAHGGAWKVAFADFMTAMMCFFLVMWLLNQTEEVKKQVASHFSGPSVLESYLTNYGAELTLEKMFLDLVNEPLKVVQDFLTPADFTPNLLSMGSKKLVLHHVAQEMGSIAKNVKVDPDQIVFEIPDTYLFETGTSDPSAQFVEVMKKVELLTAGVEDASVEVESFIYVETVPDRDPSRAKFVAEARKDMIKSHIEAHFEHQSAQALGKVTVGKAKNLQPGVKPAGYISIALKQREVLANGRKPRPLKELYESERRADMSVYEDFVRRLTEKKTTKK